MNPICSLKPLVPMSFTFIHKHLQSLTTMSQVLVLSSDLRSVCIRRDGLPLLPIKARGIVSAWPWLNPGHKNNTLIFGEVGGVFDFWGEVVAFKGGGTGPSL